MKSNVDFDFTSARRALLRWYDRRGRSFPWRDAPTPYRVWVSEIMLQQTTTQTVVGYFSRFLERFPTPTALASASEEDVLKEWEGLGYYRRARALRSSAQIIVARHNGALPSTREELEALPGVGRYAAGAILSFGFDRRAAILEANTTRLHTRLLALESDPTSSSAQTTLWSFADAWLPQESSRRARDVYRRINSALTDLGRLVCAPSNPQCDECPLARLCGAFQSGRQNELPRYKRKSSPTPRLDVALWIARADLGVPGDENDVLIVKRPEGALWSGLWDFPRFEDVGAEYAGSPYSHWSSRLIDQTQLFLEKEIGAPPRDYRLGAALKTFKHAVTRYRVTLALCRLAHSEWYASRVEQRSLFDLAPGVQSPESAKEPKNSCARMAEEWRWAPIDALASYPLSSTGRKIAEFIKREIG